MGRKLKRTHPSCLRSAHRGASHGSDGAGATRQANVSPKRAGGIKPPTIGFGFPGEGSVNVVAKALKSPFRSPAVGTYALTCRPGASCNPPQICWLVALG